MTLRQKKYAGKIILIGADEHYLRDEQLTAIDSINSPRDFMQSKALIANHAVISLDTLANAELALKDMV